MRRGWTDSATSWEPATSPLPTARKSGIVDGTSGLICPEGLKVTVGRRRQQDVCHLDAMAPADPVPVRSKPPDLFGRQGTFHGRHRKPASGREDTVPGRPAEGQKTSPQRQFTLATAVPAKASGAQQSRALLDCEVAFATPGITVGRRPTPARPRAAGRAHQQSSNRRPAGPRQREP